MSLNDIIREALNTEEKAVDSYLHSVRVLRLHGMEVKDLESVLKKVSIETMIHKEIVAGLLKAYDVALSREAEVLKGIEEISPSKLEKVIMVKLLKEHLEIESEMIETYKKMAELLEYPVLKSIAEALARNEEEHHRIILELIKKYE